MRSYEKIFGRREFGFDLLKDYECRIVVLSFFQSSPSFSKEL